MAVRPENISGRGHILVNLTRGTIEGGRNTDRPVSLASFTKLWTAATILNMGVPYNSREMREYLTRSYNDLGVVLAAQAMGMHAQAAQARRYLTGSSTANNIPAPLRQQIEGRFAVHMMDLARRLGMTTARADNTSGMNWDGVGPTASPADAARLLRYLHARDGGQFLQAHASPDNPQHTMRGYLSGLNIIGAKSGTLPMAGHYVGGMVFRGHNGDMYAGFFNTTDGGKRQAMARALVGLGRSGEHRTLGYLDQRAPAPAVAQMPAAPHSAIPPASSSPYAPRPYSGIHYPPPQAASPRPVMASPFVQPFMLPPPRPYHAPPRPFG